MFCWPQACAGWPNYEVVLLQPLSRTATSLGYDVNVTSYLNPATPFNYLLDLFLSPSVSLPPLPPYLSPLDWYALLFFTRLFPFSSGLGSPVHLDKLPLPPASTNHPGNQFIESTRIIIKSLPNRNKNKYVVVTDKILPYLGCWLEQGNSVLRFLVLQGQEEGDHQRISITYLTVYSELFIVSNIK